MEKRDKTVLSSAQSMAPGARSRGILTVTRGADVGRVVSLNTQGVTVLGRGESCTARFDDGSVSGEHGMILGMSGKFVFQDKGSTNGSFVNDERVVAAHTLKDGDRLRLGATTTLRFSLVDEQEEAELKKVYQAAQFDALTGILNRRALEERLDSELAFANRHNTELSIVMFDVDHFKRVNDTFGHLGGDAVLRTVADLVKRSLRAEDTIGRYGGEEFVVILRGIDLANGYTVADRLREMIAMTPIQFEAHMIQITASGGVASLRCTGDRRDRTTLLATADARLYRAKEGGRNRIVAV